VNQFFQKRPSEYIAETKSDKIVPVHNYGLFYDIIFSVLLSQVDKPLSVLEVGVSMFGGEASGHAFSRMPFVGSYVGIDRDPLKGPDFADKGIFVQTDAYTDEGLAAVIATGTAPYHLLIDDGSHVKEDQADFFKRYEILCADVAVMVCEDVHKKSHDWLMLRDQELYHIRVPVYPLRDRSSPDTALLVKFIGFFNQKEVSNVSTS